MSRCVGRDHKRCGCVWKHRAYVGPRSLLTFPQDMQGAFDHVRSTEIKLEECDHKMALVRGSKILYVFVYYFVL